MLCLPKFKGALNPTYTIFCLLFKNICFVKWSKIIKNKNSYRVLFKLKAQDGQNRVSLTFPQVAMATYFDVIWVEF